MVGLNVVSFIYMLPPDAFNVHNKYDPAYRKYLNIFYGRQADSLRNIIDTYAPEEPSLWDSDTES